MILDRGAGCGREKNVALLSDLVADAVEDCRDGFPLASRYGIGVRRCPFAEQPWSRTDAVGPLDQLTVLDGQPWRMRLATVAVAALHYFTPSTSPPCHLADPSRQTL